MKIVLAPNAFKNSLSASEAAQAMAEGIRRIDPFIEVVQIPVADGGDGLLDVLQHQMNGTLRPLMVSGPLGHPVQSAYLLFPEQQTAALELARASGLALLRPEQRNALLSSTRGTGELIADALDQSVKRIFIGIGGSATNDGGLGIATALGFRFLDRNGHELEPTGANLAAVHTIDASNRHPAIPTTRFDVICDVDNPLLGPLGAAPVYAPQKGASPAVIERLEAGLINLADVIERELGRDIRALPGGGAAGGAGAGLVAFLDARLNAGIDLVLEQLHFDEKLQGADLVVTAEGQLDEQTAHAKAPAGVARMAKAHQVPCMAFAGSLQGDLAPLRALGIDAAFSICPGPVPLQQAMEKADIYLANATEQALRAFLLARG